MERGTNSHIMPISTGKYSCFAVQCTLNIFITCTFQHSYFNTILKEFSKWQLVAIYAACWIREICKYLLYNCLNISQIACQNVLNSLEYIVSRDYWQWLSKYCTKAISIFEAYYSHVVSWQYIIAKNWHYVYFVSYFQLWWWW